MANNNTKKDVTITASTAAQTLGLGNRNIFAVAKLYGKQLQTLEKWKAEFVRKKIIEKK